MYNNVNMRFINKALYDMPEGISPIYKHIWTSKLVYILCIFHFIEKQERVIHF